YSWRTGGGGGGFPGMVDPTKNTNCIYSGNEEPLYDWSNHDYKTRTDLSGVNLYTNFDNGRVGHIGKMNIFHQELPHDTWDFDSAAGDFIMLYRNGKHYVVHPNKSGFIFVYNRDDAKLENVWPLVKNINFVKAIDPKTGELIGRRDFQAG